MKESEKQYIDESLKTIRRVLSDEAPEMIVQIKEAEGKVGYLYFLLASANETLDVQANAAAEVLEPKHLTAFVLKTKVDAMISGYRRERDEIQGLITSLEKRQVTGAVILRYLRGLPQE